MGTAETRTVETPRGVVTYTRYKWSKDEWFATRHQQGGKWREVNRGNDPELGPWSSIKTDMLKTLRQPHR